MVEAQVGRTQPNRNLANTNSAWVAERPTCVGAELSKSATSRA